MSTQVDVSDGWITPEGQPGLVSVIIPVYNRESLVLDALNSVEQQTYRPIEAIVVDDGSTDRTATVVQAWAQAYATGDGFHVRYVYQDNRGAPAARNHGVKVSLGNYIQYLDSDDLLLPHKIARGVQAIKQQDANMTYGKTRITDLSGRVLGHCGIAVSKSAWGFPEYSWHISGPLYRRRTVAALGPWAEHLTGSQDWEYCVRAKLMGSGYYFEERVGSVYRCHNANRISRTNFNYDYTHSTEQAYSYILALADRLGKSCANFEARMARLYFYRALEYGSHGHASDAARCLNVAGELTKAQSLMNYMVSLLQRYNHPLVSRTILRAVDLRNKMM